VICENSVTLWHNGVARHINNASIYHKICIDKNGMKQTGFFDASSLCIRIPKTKPIDISIGDYVRIGKHSGTYNRNADFVVMGICENFRGSNPHYKVVCEK